MKRLLYVLGGLLVLAVVGYIYLMQDFAKTQKLIIHNGTIITMEDSLDRPEAVFVVDGKIQKLGSAAEILALKDDHTQVIDLKGKTLMPGFIDPHTHPLISALLLNMEDLSGFTHKTPKEVWQHLAKAVKKSKPGQWIICRGLDPILTKGLVSPPMALLDSIVPNNPLLIFSQTLHNYWANSKAFETVGVTNQTPNPSPTSFYEKDAQGKLTGLIVEQLALQPFKEKTLEELGQKALIKATQQVMDNYAQAGNTTIAALGLTTSKQNILSLFEHISGQKPTLWGQSLATAGIFPLRKAAVRHFVYLRHDAMNLLPKSPQNGDDFFKILGVKYWYDGSPISGSMYMKQPYKVSKLTTESFRIKAGHKGEHLITPSKMQAHIRDLQQKGWQIATHSHGDQAISEVLSAYEAINKTQPVGKFRHRLEHCMQLDQAMLQRVKALNMTPSLHINFIYYYGDALKQSILGAQRVEHILPVKTSFTHQVHPSLHADQPMYASDPLRLINTAVNRQTKEGYVIGASETVSVWEALKSLTINAAWQLHQEQKIGSLKQGKYADFVILDKNPLKVDKTKLHTLKVLRTIVHGNTVYQK